MRISDWSSDVCSSDLKLFPGQDAVGKSFYSWGDNPIRIVGVVDHLVRPSDQGGPAAHEYSMIFPLNAPSSLGGHYLLRTEPGRRAEVLKAAVAALDRKRVREGTGGSGRVDLGG